MDGAGESARRRTWKRDALYSREATLSISFTAYPSAPYSRFVFSRTCASVAMNCAMALMKKTRSDSVWGGAQGLK